MSSSPRTYVLQQEQSFSRVPFGDHFWRKTSIDITQNAKTFRISSMPIYNKNLKLKACFPKPTPSKSISQDPGSSTSSSIEEWSWKATASSQSPNSPKQIAENSPKSTTTFPNSAASNSQRDSSRTFVGVPATLHLRVHHWQRALAGEPPDGESAARQPPYGQAYRLLLDLAGDSGFRRGLLRRQLVAAHRTRVSHREPWKNAIGVVEVLARHLTRQLA